MARNEQIINAPAERVFEVLADPRSYAYWVIGSMEVRDADPDWPEPGSRFHHTVGMGPLRIRDHTVVEKAEPDRFLQIEAKARPLGSARVKLELEPVDGRTRVTMVEDPADKPTAFVFTPLSHFLIWVRNLRSLERLAELVEGRRPMPGTEPGAGATRPQGPGTVTNPRARERRERGPIAYARAAGLGAAAGLVGAAAMSISTNTEMRLRGRKPSYAPAKALGRLLGLRTRGKRSKKMLGAAGHTATSVSLGVVHGLFRKAGAGPGGGAAGLFALAMIPEAVALPALGVSDPPWRWSRTDTAVSLLHHGVYSCATATVYHRISR